MRPTPRAIFVDPRSTASQARSRMSQSAQMLTRPRSGGSSAQKVVVCMAPGCTRSFPGAPIYEREDGGCFTRRIAAAALPSASTRASRLGDRTIGFRTLSCSIGRYFGSRLSDRLNRFRSRSIAISAIPEWHRASRSERGVLIPESSLPTRNSTSPTWTPPLSAGLP